MSLYIPYEPLYTLYNSAMFSDGGIKKQITTVYGRTDIRMPLYVPICLYMPLYIPYIYPYI